jgi:hypothetical protein
LDFRGTVFLESVSTYFCGKRDMGKDRDMDMGVDSDTDTDMDMDLDMEIDMEMDMGMGMDKDMVMNIPKSSGLRRLVTIQRKCFVKNQQN